ncbi:MAG: DUF3293 domain-containing protein [Nitriliruptoraceae bacterium]
MTDAEQRLRAELTSLEAGLDVLIDRESDGGWLSMLAGTARERVEAALVRRRAAGEGGPPREGLDLDARVELVCELALAERLGFPSPAAFESWCAEVEQARDAVGDPRRTTALLTEIRAVGERVWELADSEAGLLEAFERSRITLADAPEAELIGPGALTPLPVRTPASVLTAENPGGVRSSGADNDRRTAELEAFLRERGVHPRRVVAGSGRWRERGYLVASAQLPFDDVLALARRFGQHSVFRLTEAAVEIIRVADGVTLSRRPRRSGGAGPAQGP